MSEPVTILDTLGTLPSGIVRRLTPDQLSQYLRDKYKTSEEADRRREAKKRIDLYRDRGRVHFLAALGRVFTNPTVLKWRAVFVEFAEFQNITKRVIREISSVYSEKAEREISGDLEKYKKFQLLVRYDRKLRQVNRFGNLLNHCLVWPDVYDYGPCLNVITTDKFVPVAHPNDPLRAVAHIVDRFPRGALVRDTDPHYLGMTEFEFFQLDKEWRLVGGLSPHGLGRMPAILWNREEPVEQLLDSTTGNDLTSAHMAVALLNTLMLKHQKSGTRVPYATGDTSGIARNQPMDEDALLELGEGVSLNALDMGSSPDNYINSVRAVIKQVAANYGIPESVFDLSYQSTSGFEIELKRAGLREIRRDQMLDFRILENELADLWSTVLTNAGSEWAYSAEGFSLDLGEADTPLEPMAMLTYWEKLEELGLMNRVDMCKKLNPEFSDLQAAMVVEDNTKIRMERVKQFQEAGQALMSKGDPGGQPEDGVPVDEGVQ